MEQLQMSWWKCPGLLGVVSWSLFKYSRVVEDRWPKQKMRWVSKLKKLSNRRKIGLFDGGFWYCGSLFLRSPHYHDDNRCSNL